ncbi:MULTISPECIES: hypothetical protein [unclassified Microcoleus]|uniref:hypothetical protein n=1 Tax=unclassified Microcoleus TaxID=2642155 RepID=UPI002FD1BD81
MNFEQFVWASVPTLNIDRPQMLLCDYFHQTYIPQIALNKQPAADIFLHFRL